MNHSLVESARELPLDWHEAVLLEELVGETKMIVAEEALVSGKWRGMGRLENVVFGGIN